MKDLIIKVIFSILSALALCFAFWLYLSLYKEYKYIKMQQSEYDSMQVRVNQLNAFIDSLVSREAVVIEKHQHITNKYYENHYNIITANDSITKNNLFSNLDRYSYLHFVSPGQNNQSNR